MSSCKSPEELLAMAQRLTERAAWIISVIERLPSDIHQIAAPVLRACLMEKIDEIYRTVSKNVETKQLETKQLETSFFNLEQMVWVLGLNQNIPRIVPIPLRAGYSRCREIAEYMLSEGEYCLSPDDFRKAVSRVRLKVSSGEYDQRLMESPVTLLLEEMRSTVFSLIGRTNV